MKPTSRGILLKYIIHLIRNTFRITSRKCWDEITRDIKPICTAVNATARRTAFDDLAEKWGQRWKSALNAFAITFGDRFPAAEIY